MTARTVLTVEDLAAAKRLPPEFLRSPRVGLRDLPDRGGVGIPYYDVAGEELALKRRTAAVAKLGSYWPAGVPLAAYGLWRLDEAQRAGMLVLVEGESDCWALWHHGIPALGYPGAGSVWEAFDASQVEGVETVLISDEGDAGAEQFVESVRWALAACQWRGRAFALRWPGGTKDAAGLQQCCADRGESFADAFRAVRILARPVASAFPAAVRAMVSQMVDAKLLAIARHADRLKVHHG